MYLFVWFSYRARARPHALLIGCVVNCYCVASGVNRQTAVPGIIASCLTFRATMTNNLAIVIISFNILNQIHSVGTFI